MASKIYQLYGRRALSLSSAAGAGLVVDLATDALRCVICNITGAGTPLAFSQSHDYFDDIAAAAGVSIFGNSGNNPAFDTGTPALVTTGAISVTALATLLHTGTTLFTPGPASGGAATEADALIIYKQGTTAAVNSV